MKKTISIILSIIFAVSLIIVLFFTSMDITIYGSMPQSFVNECVKYDVLDDVGVTEEDLADVTVKMFEYLRGNREQLSDIKTTINGQPDTYFFNEKECMHMADCRRLFTAGYAIRRYCIILCIILLAVVLLINRKNIQEGWHALAVGTLSGTIGFIAVLAILGSLIAANFREYFTRFHLIFFENDLWILDPTKDRLLMIMPEGYFMDCVKSIALYFAAGLAVLLLASILKLKHDKK